MSERFMVQFESKLEKKQIITDTELEQKKIFRNAHFASHCLIMAPEL